MGNQGEGLTESAVTESVVLLQKMSAQDNMRCTKKQSVDFGSSEIGNRRIALVTSSGSVYLMSKVPDAGGREQWHFLRFEHSDRGLRLDCDFVGPRPIRIKDETDSQLESLQVGMDGLHIWEKTTSTQDSDDQGRVSFNISRIAGIYLLEPKREGLIQQE